MAGASKRTGQAELELRIELGQTLLDSSEASTLEPGSIVVFDKPAGDPVDIYVNNRLVARGQLLVLNDKFCVRITELWGRESLSAAA